MKKWLKKVVIFFLIGSGLFFLLLLILSLRKKKASLASLKKYVIPKGKHYPASLSRALLRITPIPYFWFKKRKLVAYIVLPKESLWKHGGDKDLQFDWNKAFGLNLRIWEPAHNWSCMAAFRCPSEASWEVTGYANKGSASEREIGYEKVKKDEVFWQMGAEEVFRVEVIPVDRRKVMLEVWKNTSNSGWVVRREIYKYDTRMSFVGIVGPWFGGDDSDSNGLGGVAPKDVAVYLDWSIEKQ